MKFCRYCGKQIADNAVICVNCGCMTQGNNEAARLNSDQSPEEDSSLATTSLICGIVSFFFGWLILGITAIVLACLSQKDTGGKMNPSAKGGFICGIISTSLFFVFLIILLTLL